STTRGSEALVRRRGKTDGTPESGCLSTAGLSADDAGYEPLRLRRHDLLDSECLSERPEFPAELPGKIPIRAGGRIPGYQRRAKRVDPAAGQLLGYTQYFRGGRRRPVHFPLPGRQRRKHRTIP